MSEPEDPEGSESPAPPEPSTDDSAPQASRNRPSDPMSITRPDESGGFESEHSPSGLRRVDPDSAAVDIPAQVTEPSDAVPLERAGGSSLDVESADIVAATTRPTRPPPPPPPRATSAIDAAASTSAAARPGETREVQHVDIVAEVARPLSPPANSAPAAELLEPLPPVRVPRPSSRHEAAITRIDTRLSAVTRAEAAPEVSRAVDIVLRAATLAGIFGLGALGLAQPTSILRGGVPWLGFLFFIASGWGYLVVRLTRSDDPDFGLRAIVGLAGLLGVAGVLVALGVLSNPAVLALVALGGVGVAFRELTVADPSWRAIQRGLQWLRANPSVAVLVALVVALAAVQLVGAVAALDRNPWDDDLAYTPLVKRLLDAGNLVEPFSFRRLGSYGGQTVLQSLVAARGSLASVHALDQGLCFGLALLALVGMARERGTQPLWIALAAVLLLALPNTAINTAAHWSGVALFVALYRAVAREDWVLVALVGAAACTLRQSYLVVVPLFVGIVLLSRLGSIAKVAGWSEAWYRERGRWAVVVGLTALALAGWCVAMVRSSDTFLFPIIDGTWNSELSLRPSSMTWAGELQALLYAVIETSPLAIVPLLFIVLVFARDPRIGRPLTALFAAVSLGFLVLVHGFVASDASHLWRYNFGPGIALAAICALEIGVAVRRTNTEPHVLVPSIGRWLVLAALVLQLLVHRSATIKRVGAQLADIREASAIDRRGDPAAVVEARRHAWLQATLPAGAPVAVMLDDPAFLDFSRNPIFNLDHPGYASPGDPLPLLEGPDAVRRSLLAHGIRHVAFVRSERSRYVFRRPFWVWRIFNDAELFQVMSAYTIGAIDAFAKLAETERVLYDADGLVALELRDEPPVAAPPRLPEPKRRAAFVRTLAERERLVDMWSLASRADVVFEDGFSKLLVLELASEDEPRWYQTAPGAREATDIAAPTRGTPVRWMYRRGHLRVRGDSDMRLELRGKVNLAAVQTRPRLDISIDGQPVVSIVVDERGYFQTDVTISRAVIAGKWRDLYLVWNSAAEPERDARDIRVARLEWLSWQPVTPP